MWNDFKFSAAIPAREEVHSLAHLGQLFGSTVSVRQESYEKTNSEDGHN